MWRETRWSWPQYGIIYALSFLVCWGSLATVIANAAKYVSVLSWNLFGLEELFRYHLGGADRAATSAASLIAAAAAAVIFTVTASLIRSPRLRIIGIVAAVLLLIATVLWIPNPWENM